jgi:hypothetical protein
MRRHLVVPALAWVFTLFCSPFVVAQVTTGTLVGTVRDAGGVVPAVNVTVRDMNKGTSSTYVTDDTGSYTAPFLTPGTYAV